MYGFYDSALKRCTTCQGIEACKKRKRKAIWLWCADQDLTDPDLKIHPIISSQLSGGLNEI